MTALWVPLWRRRFAGFATLLFFLAVLEAVASCGVGVPEGTERAGSQLEAPASRNAKGRQPVVILVGIDGLGWEFMERAETPTLDRLAANGVRAERLVPSFPTKTFPNHYTMVTGLYPGHHGLVANNMYDPDFDATYGLDDRPAVGDGRWYGGEPIWVTAQKQGLRTAPLFWPGSEAEIGGVRPTYHEPYDGNMSNRARIDRILGWLDQPPERRATFLTIYFSTVDDAAHDFNPDRSPEVARAVREVDSDIGYLVRELERRDRLTETNLILVSDHGMAPTSPERAICLDDYIDLEEANVIDWDPVLALWPQPENRERIYAALTGAHPRLSVYRKREIPERFHYREHRRIPPILGVADEGWTITTRTRLEASPEDYHGGSHGYDNELVSMGALFLAAGPAFRQGVVVPPFANIHLYELMCHILGIEPAPNDGNLDAVRELLRGRGE